MHLDAGRHAVEADGLLRHAGAHRCDRLGRLQDEGVTLGTGPRRSLDIDRGAFWFWTQDLLTISEEEEQQKQKQQEHTARPPWEGGAGVVLLAVRSKAGDAVEHHTLIGLGSGVQWIGLTGSLVCIVVPVVVVVQVRRQWPDFGHDLLVG